MYWLNILIFVAFSSSSLVYAQSRKTAPVKKTKTTANAKTQSTEVLVVRSIKVEGNRKIEKDAISSRLRTKVDAGFAPEIIREDVLNLFKLGFFNDIKVEQKRDGRFVDLTYVVLEKPSLTEIIYEGNAEVKTEDLVEASGLKAYEIMNANKIREALDKLQKLYEDKGYFLARIDYRIDEIKAEESSKLTFKITEGDKVKVKKIIFVGNKKLSDETLKERMFTREEGYFTFLSGSGAYKQEAFERDVQVVRYTYLNNGYIQAKVDRPQISVTPDKKGIYLTIRVDEGNQYSVGEVDFAGDLLFPRAELFQDIKIDDNGIFAYDVLQKDLQELQAKYGDLGYAYANIVPRWEFREDEKKVNLIFEIDKGNKVYIGRIDMSGNSKTRDKVIRREMRIREGELYNETRRRQSEENIQRLGFFEEVNFRTSTPPDRLDVMNIEVVVKERGTGQVNVSAGYGTGTGFVFGGSVQQTNFAGKGQNLGVSLNLTSVSQVYDVSFVEPNVNDTEWSLGGRLFRSANSGRSDYDEIKTGASLQLGHPITENIRGYLSYGYTATRLFEVSQTINGVTVKTDQDIFPLDTASGDASTLEASVAYDTRNDRFRPTKGWYLRTALANTGALGGNLKYYTGSFDARYFKNIFWDVVWRNSLQYAKIGSLNNTQDPPFNELYLLGGPYSLRGYRFSRVGAMRKSKTVESQLIAKGDPEAAAKAMRFFGGQQKLQFQTEFQFPMIKEANMYGVVFYDIGQAEDLISDRKFFSDWGFGLRWFSPLGPLRFEWGFPLNADPLYHENQVFEFSIGTPF